MQHQPNQVRAKLIGTHYTKNGAGIVTGVSRMFFALGQGVAPLACLSGYASIGQWFPWLLLSILMFLLLLFYLAQSVGLLSDPEHLSMQMLVLPETDTQTVGEPQAEGHETLATQRMAAVAHVEATVT